MALALFILEPIGFNYTLEAVDVLHFCSEECRQVIAQNTAHTTMPVACDIIAGRDVTPGLSPDWIDGTVCDECGVPLTR